MTQELKTALDSLADLNSPDRTWVSLEAADLVMKEELRAQIRNETLEEAAAIADYWGSGQWKVKHEKKKRFDLQETQAVCNTTGRGIAEDIRALKTAEGK